MLYLKVVVHRRLVDILDHFVNAQFDQSPTLFSANDKDQVKELA